VNCCACGPRAFAVSLAIVLEGCGCRAPKQLRPYSRDVQARALIRVWHVSDLVECDVSSVELSTECNACSRRTDIQHVADDGVRLRDNQRRAPVPPTPHESHPKESVACPEAASRRSVVGCQLLPQRQVFQDQFPVAAERQRECADGTMNSSSIRPDV
jgi:hypothetical protein